MQGWSRPPEQTSGADLRSRPPEQTSGADLRSRPPEQTSGADLRSRPPEQTSDQDNSKETSDAGTRQRSCNNLQSGQSGTTLLLSAEEPKDPLPKEPKLNQIILHSPLPFQLYGNSGVDMASKETQNPLLERQDAGGQACLRLGYFTVAWGIMVQRDRRAPHNAMPTTAFESIFNNQDIIPKSRTKKRKFEMTETKALATAVEETLICSNIETNTHSKLKILLSDQPLDQAPKEQVSASWLLCMLAFMVASTFCLFGIVMYRGVWLCYQGLTMYWT
ncbi:hypothetical protein Tco_1177768 [Tanacetum coccineum]